MSRKFKFRKNPTRITGTLHEDVFTFMTIPRRNLLRIKDVLNQNFRENQNTHFMFSILFHKILAFHEIKSINMVEPERPKMVQHCAYVLYAG